MSGAYRSLRWLSAAIPVCVCGLGAGGQSAHSPPDTRQGGPPRRPRVTSSACRRRLAVRRSTSAVPADRPSRHGGPPRLLATVGRRLEQSSGSPVLSTPRLPTGTVLPETVCPAEYYIIIIPAMRSTQGLTV